MDVHGDMADNIFSLFIIVDVPEIAWSDHVEKELLNELQNIATQQ